MNWGLVCHLSGHQRRSKLYRSNNCIHNSPWPVNLQRKLSIRPAHSNYHLTRKLRHSARIISSFTLTCILLYLAIIIGNFLPCKLRRAAAMHIVGLYPWNEPYLDWAKLCAVAICHFTTTVPNEIIYVWNMIISMQYPLDVESNN